MTRRYTSPGAPLGLSAAEAMLAHLTVVFDARPGVNSVNPRPTPQDLAILAMFAALTESQQDRTLQRLGWESRP